MSHSPEAVDRVLEAARMNAQIRGDGTFAILHILFDAMLEHSKRDFNARVEGVSPQAQRIMSLARALCKEDHPDCVDHPVLPPGLPPMIHRVPVSLCIHGNNDRSNTCVDVGSLIGSGPQPLWSWYIEIARRFVDVENKIK